MANFCQNCGNKLKGTDKFCTKCGTPVAVTEQNNQSPINGENIQETVDNLKETMGNVSAAVKEKAKQAVQQSQDFVQSEQFQNAKENVIEKAKQAVQYSQDVIQNEEFRNEQKDALKEKAKQAQDYLKSDEFKNVKTETANKTKGFIKNFFSCNINNNDDYVKAERQRKCCLYTIFAVIALTVVLFPFYDKWFWLDDGLWKSVLHLLSVLSVASKVVVIPVCVIAFIKYYIIHTKVIAYRAINPDIQKQGINVKKTLSVLLASVVICLVMMPVMNKVDDSAYHNYSSSLSSSTDSSADTESNNNSNWIAGKEIDKTDPTFSRVLKALDEEQLAGQSMGEIIINKMLIPGGASICVTTGDKENEYILKISGEFRVSNVATIQQDLTFNVSDNGDSLEYSSSDGETRHFVEAIVPLYLGY